MILYSMAGQVEAELTDQRNCKACDADSSLESQDTPQQDSTHTVSPSVSFSSHDAQQVPKKVPR